MIKVIDCFLRTRQKRLYIPLKNHNSCEFIYFLTGKGIVNFNDKKVDFCPHTYLFINKNISYSELYEEEGVSLIINYISNKSFDISILNGNDLDNSLLNYINNIINANNKNNIKEINLTFNKLVNKIKRRKKYLNAKKDYLIIDDIISYIDNNYVNKIDLLDLSKKTGYSIDHFRILFKEKTNYNPKAYIVNKKIELAKKLLKENKYSILEISQMCGFESYCKFMTVFKKIVKLTPKEYQKSG